MQQKLGSMMQMAYIVESLEKSIEHWSTFNTAGPFVIMDSFEIDNMRYRGQECNDLDIRLALGYSGGMCIEFIEQRCDTPSVYKDVIANRGFGFHHWALMTDKFDTEVQRYQDAGHSVCFSGKVAVGERYVYLDSDPQLHSMIEIIEYSPEVEELFSNIETMAHEWDGKQLIQYAP